MKLMIMGRRRGGLTLAQSRHYQLHQHGQLVLELIRKHPEFGPRRYVENHVFDGTYRSGNAKDDSFGLNCDFVTEVWFGSPEHAMASQQSAFYRDVVTPDEARVVDLGTLRKFPVLERVLIDGATQPQSTKVFFMLSAAPGIAPGRLQAAWRAASSNLNDLAPSASMNRHVRNETLHLPGQAPPVDLIDEFWFNDADEAHGFATELLSFSDETLCGTEQALVSPGSAFVLLTDETVMHGTLPLCG